MPRNPEELFRDAVLLVVGQAAQPVDHIVVDGVLQSAATTSGHGFDFGIPEWRSRVSIALITLEAQQMVEWADGGFIITGSGRSRVAGARGCGGLVTEIRDALDSLGVGLAKLATPA